VFSLKSVLITCWAVLVCLFVCAEQGKPEVKDDFLMCEVGNDSFAIIALSDVRHVWFTRRKRKLCVRV
jgi:hypothetical protein